MATKKTIKPKKVKEEIEKSFEEQLEEKRLADEQVLIKQRNPRA